MHPIQLFSALPSSRIQCNHAVNQLTDSSIAAPAHIAVSLSFSIIMHVARTPLPTAYLKTLKTSQSTWKLTFHLPLSYKHGAETGRSHLTLRAQSSSSPSLHHGSVQQHSAFNGNSAPSLIKWMEKRETSTNLRDAREQCGGSVVQAALNSASNVSGAAPYRIAPSAPPFAASSPSSSLCSL